MPQRTVRVFSVLSLLLSLVACERSGVHDATLYTHCGIHELQFEDQWYERAGSPLNDGSGNPPPGWDNPEQEGTVTRVDASTLLFSDEPGHREEFVLRDGAASPKQSCD